MRTIRTAALGAAILALVVSACSLGGSSQAPKGTIASQFALAGPPECPDRPFCLKGLTDTYKLTFKEFKPTDAGGPITIEALKKGDAQVGLLFTSDPAIAVNGFVLLKDDKQLQLADNLVPVVRQAAIDANPVIKDALNAVMAKLDQATLTDLNKQVTVDSKAAADVAKAWVDAQGFAFSGGSGTVKVGSTNFYEQEILGEIYAQVLERPASPSSGSSSSATARSSSRRSNPVRSTSSPNTPRRRSSSSTRVRAKRRPILPQRWRSSTSTSPGWATSSPSSSPRRPTRTVSWLPRKRPTSTASSASATCRSRRPDRRSQRPPRSRTPASGRGSRLSRVIERSRASARRRVRRAP